MQTSPSAARQSLDVAQHMLRYSLEETRRSVMDLRSQALESHDLPAALSTLARQMTVGTPIRADVRVEGIRRRLDAAHEHHLLRIGLEAVTNAVKHSGASRVDVTVRFSSNAVQLRVADNGRGTQPDTGDMSGGHFGLQGMRERANKIGAVLELESRPGRGTSLSVAVPTSGRDAGIIAVRGDTESVA
jgi:signal transduction histidine kinase